MTVDALAPQLSYTISGTGPYQVANGYKEADDILAVVWNAGVKTVLAQPADFTVSPAASTTTGDVTLSAAAATTHAGATLTIHRKTDLEQGWAALLGEREQSLADQLDRTVMGLQDADLALARALKLPDGTGDPDLPSIVADAVLAGNPAGTGFVFGPTVGDVANAAANATAAAASAAAAAADAAAAAADRATVAQIYDDFDDRYLGAFAVAPATDNDGDPLQVGAEYFDTAMDIRRVWNGTAWRENSYDPTNVAITGGTLSGVTVNGVNPADALMDAEVTSLSGIKTLSLPDNTVVSAFAKTVLDDLTAAAMLTTLGGSTTGQAVFGAADVAAARAALSLTPGADVQAWNAVLDGMQESFLTAHKAKLDFMTVTQAVDLDNIEARVNALDASVILMGTWSASPGTFPGGGTAQAGESWIVTGSGSVGGVYFEVNDRIVAITDNASTTVYAGNWHKLDYTDAVLSVAGKTGAVTLAAADIASGTFADARIAASNVTQHQAALSITEAQVSDLQPYLLDITAENLTDLADVQTLFTSASGTDRGINLELTANQSGTAGYTGWRLNVTETAIGSGERWLAELALGGVRKAGVAPDGAFKTFGSFTDLANYERLDFRHDGAGYGIIDVREAGTGNAYGIQLQVGGVYRAIVSGSGVQIQNNDFLYFGGGNAKVSGNSSAGWVKLEAYTDVDLDLRGVILGSSGMHDILDLTATVNQSGSAGYTGFKLDVSETATGSGEKLLADFAVGGVSKFKVERDGKINSARAAKINDPSGGTTQDSEARTAINAIIDALEAHGIAATA